MSEKIHTFPIRMPVRGILCLICQEAMEFAGGTSELSGTILSDEGLDLRDFLLTRWKCGCDRKIALIHFADELDGWRDKL